jgi:hypothetical protein
MDLLILCDEKPLFDKDWIDCYNAAAFTFSCNDAK